MSTFCGKIGEIPSISIDRFTEDNLDSEAFFLSHCHSDHMIGLANPDFHKKLKETNRFIYLSHVSAAILRNTHSALSDNLIELEFQTYKTITLLENSFTVIPIPAGHCPGSVMFLFESDQTVLYTGDFRMNPNDIHKFKAFYDSLGNRKKIDSVYLDTTFFLKEYEKFPSRVESLDEICLIIQDWLSRSEKHVIALYTSAKYGYEYLFIEIFKKLKMPVHVNEDIFEFYQKVPDMDRAVTRSKFETRIHSACGSTWTVICLNTIAYKIKTIRISAFRWKSDNLQDGISEIKENTHFVCYSTHASFEEGIELLKFVKPTKIFPNVLRNDPKFDSEIFKNLERFKVTDEVVPMKKIKFFKIDNQIQTTTDSSDYSLDSDT